MMIFWLPTGLKIDYDGEIFEVEDLNPQVKIRNRLSRFEMFKIGIRCIKAAAFAKQEASNV